jgi:basic membrane lipoprotein Med (substrate-binding protein (PBP1-ABC) superfamily)
MSSPSLIGKIPKRWLSTILLAAILAACGSTESTATPTVAPTVEPTFTPSPTPLPVAVLMAPAQPRSATELLARRAVEEFVSAQGWVLNRVEPGVEILGLSLQENPRLVAAVGSGMVEQIATAAAANPGLRFVVVEESGVTPAANLLVVGGDNVRGDQAAFLAGLLAGIENGNDYVGWVGEAGTARGTIYRNGFRHGIRYVCPYCTVFYYDLPSSEDVSAGLAAAESLVGDYADTASAIPGPAGDAALQELSRRKVRVAGAQADFYEALFAGGTDTGASHVLGGLAFRPDILLADLLPRYIGGENFDAPVSYSLENGGMEFAAFPNDWISPGRQTYLKEILADLVSGRLDIGVDRLTGEES